MYNTPINDEISYLYHATFQCCEEKEGCDGAWQLAPFQCSIPYNKDGIKKLNNLKEHLRITLPELIDFGARRAKRAYVNRNDTITKPSYISRLLDYLHGNHNQNENMLAIASNEPMSGGLVFSVFSPQDLIDRRRPGYVPCLISGSFLVHQNELHLNAFFRSQSIVEFGLFDLLFLRKYQKEFYENYKKAHPENKKIKIGPLNLLMGRILVHRRFLKSNNGYVKRENIVPMWLSSVEEYMLTNIL